MLADRLKSPHSIALTKLTNSLNLPSGSMVSCVFLFLTNKSDPMSYVKHILSISALTVLAGCAAPEGSTEVAFKDDSYTPTGSLIPRKKVERDGKQHIVSGEELQRVIDSTPTALKQ